VQAFRSVQRHDRDAMIAALDLHGFVVALQEHRFLLLSQVPCVGSKRPRPYLTQPSRERPARRRCLVPPHTVRTTGDRLFHRSPSTFALTTPARIYVSVLPSRWKMARRRACLTESCAYSP